jgi:hypothetical protein
LIIATSVRAFDFFRGSRNSSERPHVVRAVSNVVHASIRRSALIFGAATITFRASTMHAALQKREITLNLPAWFELLLNTNPWSQHYASAFQLDELQQRLKGITFTRAA